MVTKLKYDQKKRIDKSLNERFFLVDYSDIANKLCFNICGTTGNIYKITINTNYKNISCNCPDNIRCRQLKCLCKHCCFVLLKVLKVYIVNSEDYLINRFSNRVADLFETLKFSENININIINSYENLLQNLDSSNYDDKITERYILLRGKHKDVFHNSKRELDINDNCPICLCEFKNKELVINCPSCHNYIHKSCIEDWIKVKANCPMCRSKSFSNYIEKQYINLST